MSKKEMHSIKYNYFMNIILTGGTIIFPLITFPYVSRILGVESMGRVAFATTVIHYFLNVAALGIPTYGLREGARVRDDDKELGKLTYELLIISGISTMLVLALYFASIIFVPKFHEDRTLFYINSVMIIFNNMGAGWLFASLEKYDYITIRAVMFKALAFVMMLFLVRNESDYLIYAGILAFATVCPCILNFAWVIKNVKIRKSFGCDLKKHLKPIFLLWAQSMMITVYTQLDTVMIGIQRGNREVGYYDAAIKIKTGLLAVVRALGNVTSPRMIYYKNSGMWNEFNTVLKKTIDITLFSAVPLSIYSSLMAKDFIFILAGNEYTGAISAMQIITLSVIPIGLSNILSGNILVAYNKEKEMLYLVTFGAVIDLVMNLYLIQKYGAAGAAFATTVTEIVTCTAMFFLCTRKAKVIMQKMNLKICFFSGIDAGVSMELLCWNLEGNLILRLFLTFSIFALVYISFCYILKEPVTKNFFKCLIERRNK